MLTNNSKNTIAVLITAAALVFGLTMGLTAQDKAGDKAADSKDSKDKKEWKGQEEYSLYEAYTKAATPAAKIAALDKWKAANPDSAFAEDRKLEYLGTYQQAMQWRQVIDTAQDILKTQPNNVTALTAIVDAVQKLKPPTPADLDLLEKTAYYIWDNLDTIYGASNKPANMKEEDFAKIKPQMKPYLVQTEMWVIDQRKDNERAEADLAKLLQKDPTQAQVSYKLATTILANAKADNKPEEQPRAMYHWARAAAYDGPGSIPAADRQKLQTSLTNAYKAYHGSTDGLNELLMQAKSNPFPPSDFKMLSTVDIAQAQAKADAEAAAKDPMRTFWVKALKEPILMMGDAYFDMNVKDSLLPGPAAPGFTKFKGKIVSITPAIKPKEIDLAIEKPGVADAKLMLEAPLAGKMEAGEELSFEGVAQSYTKDPFSITFKVDKDQLSGWTGKNTPAAATKGKAATKSKGKAK